MSSPATAPITFERGDDLRRLASCRRDRVRFVEIPEKRYLAVDGTAPPGSDAYVAAIGALYGTAYPLHFALRGRGVRGHRVGMLEGLYWISSEQLMAGLPTGGGRPLDMRWRLMIAVPDDATEDEVDAVIRAAGEKAEGVYLDRRTEGRCAQILHVGPYRAEAHTLGRLFGAIADAGLHPRGPHHEIYLNDPRAVGEERTRTVLRQPVGD